MLMRALRVRAEMSGAVAIPGRQDIHLDALLAWAWLVHHPHVVERDIISRRTPRADVLSFRGYIPLSMAQLGIHEVALCTAWRFPGTAKLETMRWTRRKDGTDMTNRARAINPSSLERPLFCRGDVVLTPYIEWLAWGQLRQVKREIRCVRQVGGLRAHGYGKVRRWTVEESDHAPAETWFADGETQRSLPVEACESLSGVAVEHLAVQPPYWVPSMHVPAVSAGVSCAPSDAALDVIRAEI